MIANTTNYRTNKMPKMTIAKYKEKVAKLLQRLVRMKYADDDGYCTCVTCGKVDHWKSMDGGHFISRKYNATVLVEKNIHPQCKGCNRYMSGRYDDYALFMIDTYGEEFVRELNQSKYQVKKFTRFELEELESELKDRISEQEDRLI